MSLTFRPTALDEQGPVPGNIQRILPTVDGRGFLAAGLEPRLALQVEHVEESPLNSIPQSGPFRFWSVIDPFPKFLPLQWHNNRMSPAQRMSFSSCDCRIPTLPHTPSPTPLHRVNRRATAYNRPQLMPVAMASLHQSRYTTTTYRSAT
jgi:hypothetical protein